VAAFVGATVRLLGGNRITLLFEQHPSVEGDRTVTAFIHSQIIRRMARIM
jgi:hypothetical protein